MLSKKKIFAAIIIFAIFIVLGFFIKKVYFTEEKVQVTNSGGTNQNSGTYQVKIVPLKTEEREKVVETITASEFTKEIPEESPIYLRFFYFEEGKRVWQDQFLIGDGRILQSGEPLVYLTLHSKYIEKIEEIGLCETIKIANANGDLGFESKTGKTKLLMEYSGLLEYRECFGF